MNILIKFSICGVLLSFLFPPFFILPLGFVVFPYLFFLLINKEYQNKSKFFQFNAGLIFGITMNFVILIWIKEPFLIDKSTSSFAILSYTLVLYCSFYFGLIFLILSFVSNKISKLILLPVLFVGSEIIRENFLYGFPWVTFALTYSGNDFLLSLIYYLGTYGLSYFSILFFIFPVSIIFLYNKTILKVVKIYFFTSIFIILFGFTLASIRLYDKEEENGSNLKITIAQLNISQIEKNKKIDTETRINEINNIITDNFSDLIIFSEVDYPYIVKNLEELNFISNNLKYNQSIIIGGIKKENLRFYNSFFFMKKNFVQEFHKIKLVPFGEFLPFRKLFFFLEPIVGNNDFSIGEKERLININKDLSIIPIICYEIIFPKILINKENKNTSLMINITNDSWFGSFSGPHQHFYLAKMRAVEFNKYLIRVSNNGISAIINNKGKIIDATSLNEKTILNRDIDIPFSLQNYISLHFLIYLVLPIILIISLLINKKKYE